MNIYQHFAISLVLRNPVYVYEFVYVVRAYFFSHSVWLAASRHRVVWLLNDDVFTWQINFKGFYGNNNNAVC